MATFSIEAFAAECKKTMAREGCQRAAVEALLRDALRTHDAADIIEALEAAVPAGAAIGELIVHQSPELTMLYARIPARFRSGIHNHTVTAVIGQLTGEERSTVYERGEDGGLREVEQLAVKPGEVMSLGKDAIHHIENPTDETARSLHLYGGDFGALMGERSLWEEQEHAEIGFSFEELLKQSVIAMKKGGNERGIEAMSEAMPVVKKLVASL